MEIEKIIMIILFSSSPSCYPPLNMLNSNVSHVALVALNHECSVPNSDQTLMRCRKSGCFLPSPLQRAVDEKFRSVEEKEEENRRLQLLLRDKERDLERQRCVLANNEETITVSQTSPLCPFLLLLLFILHRPSLCLSQSLEALLRGKALELEQVSDAWRGVRQRQQDDQDQQKLLLRERDRIIDQLQGALLALTQEAQVQRRENNP